MKRTDIKIKKEDRYELTSQGFLVVDANLTRSGVFDYFEDGKRVRENRPPEEVFNEDSLKSLQFAPLTKLHPDEMISPENIKKHQVGFIGENIKRKGDFAAGKVIITDKKEIDEVIAKFERNEPVELSMGYDAKVVELAGTHPGDGKFDKTQTNIIYNHASIVPRGRAGRDVKLIMDAEQEASMFLDVEVIDESKFDELLEDQERPKQTVIISKEAASSLSAARSIANEFLGGDEKFLKSEETGTSFRFRVREPGQFKERSFRTFQPKGKEGVSIVFGTLKNSKTDQEVQTVKFKRAGIEVAGFRMDAIEGDIGDESKSVVDRLDSKLDEAISVIGKQDEAVQTVTAAKDSLQAKHDQLEVDHKKLKEDHDDLMKPDSPKLQALIKGRTDMEAHATALGVKVAKEDGSSKESAVLRNEIIAAVSGGKFDAEGKDEVYLAARYDGAVEIIAAAKKEDGDKKFGDLIVLAKKEPEAKTDAAGEFDKKSAELSKTA